MSKTKTAIEIFKKAERDPSANWQEVARKLLDIFVLPKKSALSKRTDGFLDIVDYQPKGREKTVGPTMVTTFEDGRTVRMTFATQTGLALNTGRGLRHCINSYRLYAAKRNYDETFMAAIEVPPITSAYVEINGNIIGNISPDEANSLTIEQRRSRM